MTGLETPAGWAVAKKTTEDIPLWQKEPASFRFMELLPERKTLYVRHSVNLNDGEKTIAAFFTNMAGFIEKNDVQKLILDIRTNGGGNNQLNKPMITSIIRSVKINQKGKFFCIIGRRTFSAAQNLVNELEKYTEVTFIGEPTSENVNFYGDTRTETLSNSKLQANLSWLWWQNLDPRDKRKATAPELAVDMSFADYYNNEDPALNAIFNYENEKPFAQILSDKIKTGNKSEALNFALEYKNDPKHRYVSDRLEADINREGYNKMQNNNIDIASALFEINIKLFPESANAYDSYAECHLNMGNKDMALKYYQMAIEKDKDGATAENARKAIEKIKSH
jgi:tetratricopeptide (TPR) repeat protein